MYLWCVLSNFFFYFFFNDTATTEIYTLSLHDALPIFYEISSSQKSKAKDIPPATSRFRTSLEGSPIHYLLFTIHYSLDRKSTRLNSSHANISYAVFCLKKKKKNNTQNKSCVTISPSLR